MATKRKNKRKFKYFNAFILLLALRPFFILSYGNTAAYFSCSAALIR